MSLKKQYKKQTEEPTKQKINIILLKKKRKKKQKETNEHQKQNKTKIWKKLLIIEKIKFN